MELSYFTAAGVGESRFIERKSEFIGRIAPITCEKDAHDFIERIRREERGATHNVWVYILRDGVKRYSDDGEPAGTAGVPALEVIEREGLVNVCIVITRYFGGILLGAGGLIRAYAKGAKAAIDAGGKEERTRCYEATVRVSYGAYGGISRGLDGFRAKVMDIAYTEAVTLKVLLHHSEVERFTEWVREITLGSGEITVMELGYEVI